jgi:putative phosphonate metabolism protein
LRYAIYHTPPPDHPLTTAAAKWLGRDAFDDADIEVAHPLQWTKQEHLSLVADAARYGFHATLKAPFYLASSRTESELLQAFKEFENTAEPLTIHVLTLRQIDGFFALVPDVSVDAVQDFAARVVETFDAFRAPLTPADVARRNPEKLSARQRSYLEDWGYPYVFEEFFFHMTLTNRVAPEKSNQVRLALEEHFVDFIGKPYAISHIALFSERSQGAKFHVQSIREISGDIDLQSESFAHAQ